jgi:histidinol-phosphatase (PHP family)
MIMAGLWTLDFELMTILSGLADYHMHTKLCGHATGTVTENVEAAIARGLDEMGFSEHIYLYHLPPEERDPVLAMREEMMPAYVEMVREAQRGYPQITIRLGLEADYIEGHEAQLERALVPHPWDYVYGSVHYIDGWGFDDDRYIDGYSRWQIDDLYARYFELVIKATATGLFDVMAHLDLAKKFGYRPNMDLGPLYGQVAAALAEAGVCIEVSSAGLRMPVAEIYPHPDLLRACCLAGVPATLGSDAHQPGQVGFAFPQLVAALRAAGYTQVVRFQARRRTFHPLPSLSDATPGT